jgi:hypothetical protein
VTSLVPAIDLAGGITQRFPWFLPGGEHFLFDVSKYFGAYRPSSPDGGVAWIDRQYTRHEAFQFQNRLCRGEAVVGPRGHTDAPPFEVKALRATGEAVPIAERVESAFGQQSGSFRSI